MTVRLQKVDALGHSGSTFGITVMIGDRIPFKKFTLAPRRKVAGRQCYKSGANAINVEKMKRFPLGLSAMLRFRHFFLSSDNCITNQRTYCKHRNTRT